MFSYDPKSNLSLYPMPMGRYGTNPYGEDLYRIVFAPSRRMLAGANGVFQWIPAYRPIGDKWVLERWHDPFKFTGCSPKVWDEKYADLLGPYPSRGEYSHAFTFEAAPPDQCDIGKLVAWIEEGATRSFQDHRDACQAEYDQEDKDTRRFQDALARDSVSAFGVAPFVGGSGVTRGSKTAKIVKTAEELGLPTGNKFMNLQREE